MQNARKSEYTKIQICKRHTDSCSAEWCQIHMSKPLHWWVSQLDVSFFLHLQLTEAITLT